MRKPAHEFSLVLWLLQGEAWVCRRCSALLVTADRIIPLADACSTYETDAAVQQAEPAPDRPAHATVMT